MQFFTIPNLSSQTAEPIESPWTRPLNPETPYHLSKLEFSAWAVSYTTQHCYISTYEGMSAQVRVGGDNPVFRIHGIIADYDGLVPPNPSEHFAAKPQSEFMPQWCVRTHSDKARLVWHFERPVLIVDPKHLKNFLRVVTKNLKVDRWLAGLDTKAFGNPNQYYELGKKWDPVAPNAVIPMPHLELWLLQAAEGLQFGNRTMGAGAIPMADLAVQVKEQFPGRWHGEFAVGARGVRFWDPSADNPTGAVVRADGMQCFTGNQAFVGWKQIFGPAFTDKYETSAIADIVDGTAYDGRSFWTRSESDGWRDVSKEDFAQILRVRGVNPSRKPGETSSELDRLEAMIKSTRRVKADAPFLYDTNEIVVYKGERYLNTARVKCLQPAPRLGNILTFSDGREHFPFLYKLLRTMFNSPEDDEFTQLEAFLAWLQYFYVNSLKNDPKKGQCLLIAGPAGKGKTLLVKRVLAPLMAGDENGEQDATDHLVEGSKFNDRLMYAPIWRIDDQIPKGDRNAIKEFTARIKRAVSDPDTVSEQKFKTSRTTPHYGRIIVLCNLDGESMQIMPSTDQSTLDKLSLFRASDHVLKFPENSEVERLCRQELPYFARFLVDWPTPERWVAESRRFGITSYHHPELLEEARQQNVGHLLEMLLEFLEHYKTQYPEKPAWSGTATRLYDDLTAMNPGVMRHMKPHAVGIQLGNMCRNGYNLAKRRMGDGSYVWDIGYVLAERK